MAFAHFLQIILVISLKCSLTTWPFLLLHFDFTTFQYNNFQLFGQKSSWPVFCENGDVRIMERTVFHIYFRESVNLLWSLEKMVLRWKNSVRSLFVVKTCCFCFFSFFFAAWMRSCAKRPGVFRLKIAILQLIEKQLQYLYCCYSLSNRD